MTEKRCLMNYGTHFVPTDTSYRVTVKPNLFCGAIEKYGYETAASLLYIWCIAGRYRRTRKSLESWLSEKHANVGKLVDLAFSENIIQEKDGKLTKKFFPGLIHIEDAKVGDGRDMYKLDIEGYVRVYESRKNSKRGLRDLGRCLSLLPYLNQRYGFICANPDETDLYQIRPLSLKEIGELIGCSSSEMTEFIRGCSEYLNYDSEKKITLGGIARIKNGRRVFMVNARFLYHRDTDPLILSWFWDEEFVIEDWDKKYA